MQYPKLKGRLCEQRKLGKFKGMDRILSLGAIFNLKPVGAYMTTLNSIGLGLEFQDIAISTKSSISRGSDSPGNF